VPVSSKISNTRRKELALIHVAKNDLVKEGRLNESSYRLTVESVLIDRGLEYDTERPSSARLDGVGRRRLISILKERHGWSGDNRSQTNRRESRYSGRGSKQVGTWLTQAQADRISRLEDDLGWATNPDRLLGFIERQIGSRATVEMLSVARASKVILGLERMLKSTSDPQ
jgi:hypothetical protein